MPNAERACRLVQNIKTLKSVAESLTIDSATFPACKIAFFPSSCDASLKTLTNLITGEVAQLSVAVDTVDKTTYAGAVRIASNSGTPVFNSDLYNIGTKAWLCIWAGRLEVSRPVDMSIGGSVRFSQAQDGLHTCSYTDNTPTTSGTINVGALTPARDYVIVLSGQAGGTMKLLVVEQGTTLTRAVDVSLAALGASTPDNSFEPDGITYGFSFWVFNSGLPADFETLAIWTAQQAMAGNELFHPRLRYAQ